MRPAQTALGRQLEAFLLVLAVVLTLSLWAIGYVPFSPATFCLHVISIYIGVAAVRLLDRRS